MTDADIIENHIETLSIQLDCFMFANADFVINNPDKMEAIRFFVNWCIQDEKEALVVPRGKEGTSYIQRRETTWVKRANHPLAGTERQFLRETE